MADQLFALQRDLEELSEDMQQLKRSYNTVDFIAHTVKNLWDEQMCQAEQMRRMEKDIAQLKDDVATLKSDVAEIKVILRKLVARKL